MGSAMLDEPLTLRLVLYAMGVWVACIGLAGLVALVVLWWRDRRR